MIVIVGPGAVGSTLGVAFRNLGHEVAFAGREGWKPHHITLRVQGNDYDQEFADGKATVGDASIVFVAVKAYQLAETQCFLRQFCDLVIPVVFLSNGDISAEIAKLGFDSNRMARRGMVTLPVTELGPNEWRLAGTGEIIWGPVTRQSSWATPIEKDLVSKESLFPIRLLDDIAPLVNEKWLLNTALNTLCAAKELRSNDQVLEHLSELRSLFEEAVRLGGRLFGAWQTPPEQLWERLITLINNTAANENSMARDFRTGKRTESAYLAGRSLAFPGQYPVLESYHRKLDRGRS
jgi:2-dehydropantoate 2-reductase